MADSTKKEGKQKTASAKKPAGKKKSPATKPLKLGGVPNQGRDS